MIPPFRREFDAAMDPVAAHYALNLGKAATWTPTLTFATPGDLSVAYTTRQGTIVSIGSLRIVTFSIVTSTFTFTTASGNLQVTGLTLANSAAVNTVGTMQWQGITKAGHTQIVPRLANSATTILFTTSGSGVSSANVAAADMPSGGTVILRGQIIYNIS